MNRRTSIIVLHSFICYFLANTKEGKQSVKEIKRRWTNIMFDYQND